MTKNTEDKYCSICYLQQVNNPKMKYHLFDTGAFAFPDDKHICGKCLAWIHALRRKASEQAKHPEKDVFKDVGWWWKPEKNGVSAAAEIVK